MAETEKPGDGEEGDVLSNLPRSRRQRPSARREQARAERDGNGAGTAGRAPGPGKATPAAAADEEATTPSAPATGHEDRDRPRKRVPAAGYATVREPGSYGNADPDELLKSFVRGVLRRLPG